MRRPGVRSAVACLALCCMVLVSAAASSAQPTMSLQGGLFGPSLNWISVIVEAPVITFNKGVSQSLRASIAYGAPFLNATYVPLQAHYIMFRKNDHLEFVAGMNLEIDWHPRTNSATRELTSSQLNPSFAIGYRYEPPIHGFVFRIGLAAGYIVADDLLFPCTYITCGHSF